MAEKEGRGWKLLNSVTAVVVAAGVLGGIVLYGDVRVVRANDDAEVAHELRQDEILEKIPMMEGNISTMAATMLRIEKKLNNIAKVDKELAIENAKHHHKHGRSD